MHSEVLNLHSHIVLPTDNKDAFKVLDLGCGSGRNSLYLQQLGYQITALDKNETSIHKLNTIIKDEQLNNIVTSTIDLNSVPVLKEGDTAQTENMSDLVLSTVVLMFLQPKNVENLIKQIQVHTKLDGYNLIVCAMNTKEHSYDKHDPPFEFGCAKDELKNHYKNWEILHYEENLGSLHRQDAFVNPITLQFAMLLAKKTIE